MTPFEGEEILWSADNKLLTVTTHRVRYVSSGSGSGRIISMMIDAVTSCELTHTTYPLLLALAAVVFLAGAVGGRSDGTPMAIGFVIAIVLVVLYFTSRRQVVRISSPSAHIDVRLLGMSVEQASSVLDTVEHAKNARR